VDLGLTIQGLWEPGLKAASTSERCFTTTPGVTGSPYFGEAFPLSLIFVEVSQALLQNELNRTCPPLENP